MGTAGRARFKERTASLREPPAPRMLLTTAFILLRQRRQMLTSSPSLLGPDSAKSSPNHLFPCATPRRCAIPGVSSPGL